MSDEALSFRERLASVGASLPAGTDEPAPGSYRALLEQSGLEPARFAEAVSLHHGLPRTTLAEMRTGKPLADRFSPRFLLDHALFPYLHRTGRIHIAVADPSDRRLLEIVDLTLGARCVIEVAPFDELELLLRDVLGASTTDREPEAGAASADAGPLDDVDPDDLRDIASGAPVVRTMNDIFDRAVALRATDIHIEPFRRTLQVRFRIDGMLRSMPSPPFEMARALVSRVKILAGLNIAERRLPQDGRARVRVGNADVDLRVATTPTLHGEAAILRLLERNQRLLDLGRVGLGARDRAVIEHHLDAPHGLLVVTGPTGSGKTTTLASALAKLNKTTRKIITIEDPVEYEIQGVNQTQAKPAIGLTFASALRSFLRQDPDVIMVGEMRDGETARIGIQASLTGHLVMTTLHTNTAAASITRLIDMGVEPFLIASTLRCIVGQRLVRVLCPDCSRMAPLEESTIAGDPRFSGMNLRPGELLGEPVGCERCGGTGYRGRVGVFEVLEVSEPIRRLIGTRRDDDEIEREARREGMVTMIEDGVAKCRAGVTSLDEVLRVTASR
jgi:general secretion pathway protein E